MKNTVLLVLIMLAAGCAPMDRIVYDTQTRQPTPNVDIYKDGELPTRHYKVICELLMPGNTDNELLRQRQITEEAKRLGGNGLIFYVSTSGHDSAFRGKVIVYDP
jgi:hypothetical protein